MVLGHRGLLVAVVVVDGVGAVAVARGDDARERLFLALVAREDALADGELERGQRGRVRRGGGDGPTDQVPRHGDLRVAVLVRDVVGAVAVVLRDASRVPPLLALVERLDRVADGEDAGPRRGAPEPVEGDLRLALAPGKVDVVGAVAVVPRDDARPPLLAVLVARLAGVARREGGPELRRRRRRLRRVGLGRVRLLRVGLLRRDREAGVDADHVGSHADLRLAVAVPDVVGPVALDAVDLARVVLLAALVARLDGLVAVEARPHRVPRHARLALAEEEGDVEDVAGLVDLFDDAGLEGVAARAARLDLGALDDRRADAPHERPGDLRLVRAADAQAREVDVAQTVVVDGVDEAQDVLGLARVARLDAVAGRDGAGAAGQQRHPGRGDAPFDVAVAVAHVERAVVVRPEDLRGEGLRGVALEPHVEDAADGRPRRVELRGQVAVRVAELQVRRRAVAEARAEPRRVRRQLRALARGRREAPVELGVVELELGAQAALLLEQVLELVLPRDGLGGLGRVRRATRVHPLDPRPLLGELALQVALVVVELRDDALVEEARVAPALRRLHLEGPAAARDDGAAPRRGERRARVGLDLAHARGPQRRLQGERRVDDAAAARRQLRRRRVGGLDERREMLHAARREDVLRLDGRQHLVAPVEARGAELLHALRQQHHGHALRHRAGRGRELAVPARIPGTRGHELPGLRQRELALEVLVREGCRGAHCAGCPEPTTRMSALSRQALQTSMPLVLQLQGSLRRVFLKLSPQELIASDRSATISNTSTLNQIMPLSVEDQYVLSASPRHRR